MIYIDICDNLFEHPMIPITGIWDGVHFTRHPQSLLRLRRIFGCQTVQNRYKYFTPKTKTERINPGFFVISSKVQMDIVGSQGGERKGAPNHQRKFVRVRLLSNNG